MKLISLPKTNLTVSKFSFGTASLHRLGGIKKQVSHLGAAVDAGFTHFDTSPLYGFGCSEISLGKAFSVRDHSAVTVATKVGLYAPGGSWQPLISMKTRKLFGRVISPLSRPIVDWTLSRAKVSLDESFARLGREQIDIVFIHEPDFELINTDEWLSWLKKESQDRVGFFGLAGSLQKLEPFIKYQSPLANIIQINDSFDKKEADILTDFSQKIQFTYGYFSSSPKGASGDDILLKALERNETGSIIVYTKNRARFQTFSDFSD